MRSFAAATIAQPPFPSRVNPHLWEAGRRSARWAAGFGLTATGDTAARLAKANAADLAGRACPDADPDRLILLTDLITWLFAFDDACDDDGLGDDPARLAPVVAGLLDIVDLIGHDAPEQLLAVGGPLGAALHDLGRRVRGQSQPGLLLRFTRELRDYLLALLWEAANRASRRVPSVTEYVQMRRHTGAVYPSFTLTDIAHGADPDADRLADPRLSRLDTLAADLVCWCNDLFSYDKERRSGSDGHNLAVTIAAESGRGEEAALVDAAGRFNTALGAYLEVERAVLADGDPQVARFTAARRCWIRGTYDWSLGASRYH